ncbi:hypothetical protein HDU67_002076 [Dinochytrium kinnereticum]|nr:hypothetical protein HDU67_002076 [Dinochytrium kinnereticum]
MTWVSPMVLKWIGPVTIVVPPSRGSGWIHEVEKNNGDGKVEGESEEEEEENAGEDHESETPDPHTTTLEEIDDHETDVGDTGGGEEGGGKWTDGLTFTTVTRSLAASVGNGMPGGVVNVTSWALSGYNDGRCDLNDFVSGNLTPTDVDEGVGFIDITSKRLTFINVNGEVGFINVVSGNLAPSVNKFVGGDGFRGFVFQVSCANGVTGIACHIAWRGVVVLENDCTAGGRDVHACHLSNLSGDVAPFHANCFFNVSPCFSFHCSHTTHSDRHPTSMDV